MIVAYVALGANLGNPQQTIRHAIAALDEITETLLIQTSSLYRSAPHEARPSSSNEPQPDYINAVAELETKLSAPVLLTQLQLIEQAFGRDRNADVPRNAARTLDLDLLLYGNLDLQTATLMLPHPRMHKRAFVLKPLLEIAPQVMIPGIGLAAAYLGAVAGQAIERLT